MASFLSAGSENSSRLSIISIAILTIVAFGSYFAVQTSTENNVKEALLEAQKQRQIDNAGAIAARIESSIDSVIARMQLMANEPVLQSGDLTSDRVTELLEQQYQDLARIAVVSEYSATDENNILANTVLAEHKKLIGADLSQREYVIKVRDRLEPYVTSSFDGLDGRRNVAIGIPIINRESSQYVGLLSLTFLVPDFFQRYQNDQITRIVAFDRNQVYISTTVPEFFGQEYWGDRVQSTSRANPQLNEAFTTLFSGKPTSTLFVSAVTNEERFVAASPVFYQDEQVMSIAVTTSTAAIYSQVSDILFAQVIQTIAMLVAIVGAIAILILYLSKWNKTLDINVKQKTAEIKRSNERLFDRTKELEEANKQLIQHDKMQEEFINIAAHELRTPIQPLISIAELLDEDFQKTGKIELGRPEFEMLKRNTRRLERLSSDILQVSRIESQSLKLDKEKVNLSEKITHVVADVQSFVPNGRKLRIVVKPFDANLAVFADRAKLFEILANLLGNAVKFTQEGTITISVEAHKNHEGDYVSVSIMDTGIGIETELIPKLFTKFVSKSDQGTGLGLFISKSIVEAHGGKIWFKNNKECRGATFTFTLPVGTDRVISSTEKVKQ